jgi:hypothetical protein
VRRPEEEHRPGEVFEEPVLRKHLMGSDAEIAEHLAVFTIGYRG